MNYAVIMAGGSGERFWPLSRRLRPKQLLRLTSPDHSMLEEAVHRIEPLVTRERVIIATATHLAEPICESHIVPAHNVVAEPDKRNTLGCLCWVAATLLARHNDDDPHQIGLAILTADHLIRNSVAFQHNVQTALEEARRFNALVTIGIRPTRPETGYGYIEVAESSLLASLPVKSFREKPDRQTAIQFVSSGRFTWNSGMFFWTIGTYLEQLEEAHPEAHRETLAIAEAFRLGNQSAAIEAFRRLPNLSIDYALMEKAKIVRVVPSSFDWDDVGAFDALVRTLPPDEHGNVVIGEVTIKDCTDSVFYNDAPGVMTAVNMHNMIFVRSEDATLVAPLNDAQRVKEINQLIDERYR